MIAYAVLVRLLVGLVGDGTYEVGRFSHYAPGDGSNGGELACGGQFTREQVHIAYRRWYKRGCGSAVVVYSATTGKWKLTTIQDGGPYGIYKGPLKYSHRPGNWRVYTGSRPPEGWKWRGLLDASYGLWLELGRPRFLSRVHLIVLPSWVNQLRTNSRVLAWI